jgi:hypothetical protein
MDAARRSASSVDQRTTRRKDRWSVSRAPGRRPGTDSFAYDFTFPRERVTRSKSVRVTIQ